MAPGSRNRFGAPLCSNLMSFGRKCTVLKKVLVTLLILCNAPAVIQLPGKVAPFPLRYAPVSTRISIINSCINSTVFQSSKCLT